MSANAREAILQRLKSAAAKPLPLRPVLPSLRESAMTAEQLVATFVDRLTEQGGVAHQVAGHEALWAAMSALFEQERVTRAMATTDEVAASLDLVPWGRQIGVEILTPEDFKDRDSYIRTVFDEVQAGISGADFAVAESGTLVLVHDARQARLVSLAPVLHIAVVPAAQIVPTYETAMTAIYAGGRRPSQVTYITGPSMTADIQGTPFKGMHGPQKLHVLLTG